NRIHAILGASEDCVATHPSDMCVALAALEAVVHVQGRAGRRTIEFADFHRLPGDAPQRDNQLADDELIIAVELPANGFVSHNAYLKIRDRASYAFALISVAAAIELDGEVIRDVRLALGGVAHKPWRDKAVEALLIGKPVTRENFAAAADAMLEDAQPLEHNGFKVRLARRAIIRALSDAATGGSAQ
ncbi:xanthine dehydrogenase family protein subunit M, partial [Pseudomonas syringae]